MAHDTTAGMIKTPGGAGRFVEYDEVRKMITVEMDFEHLVVYPAEKCFIHEERGLVSTTKASKG